MYFLLLFSSICLALSSIGSKLNNAKGCGKLLSATAMCGGAGVMAWIVTLLAKERVTADMFLYAGIFSVCFVTCMVFVYKTYEKGPLAVTSLFANASLLIVVVLFSSIYFHEPMSFRNVIGLIGVLISLTLLTLPKEKGKDEKKANLVWLGLCLIVLFLNSVMSITAKIRQVNVDGTNPFAYMALCYTFSFVVGVVAYGVLQIKKKTFTEDIEGIRRNTKAIALQAFGNVGANMLVTFLSSRIDGVILYPVNKGCGLLLTVLCGFCFFKEKKSWTNIVGIVLGIISIVVLSI